MYLKQTSVKRNVDEGRRPCSFSSHLFFAWESAIMFSIGRMPCMRMIDGMAKWAWR